MELSFKIFLCILLARNQESSRDNIYATVHLYYFSFWWNDYCYKILNSKLPGQSFLVYFLLLLFSETGSCYIVQAGLWLHMCLPQYPKCWDYRCMPPHSVCVFCFVGNCVVENLLAIYCSFLVFLMKTDRLPNRTSKGLSGCWCWLSWFCAFILYRRYRNGITDSGLI
jgi:hypothetical protein